MTPKSARKILFDTYWSSRGWKANPQVSAEDLQIAKAAGMMFDPVDLTHDEVIEWLMTSYRAVSLESVRDAFLASLSTRRLELRSALGSFAVARHFPVHPYRRYEIDRFSCSVCGLFHEHHRTYDLNLLNVERYLWGGASHYQPDYAAFDLDRFAKLERVEPTKEDNDIFRMILKVIRQSGANAKPRDLEKSLTGIFPSNKREREILIQILGYCGILQRWDHPGFWQFFVPYEERVYPPERTFWTYPVIWWRGRDGINMEVLRELFPEFVSWYAIQ